MLHIYIYLLHSSIKIRSIVSATEDYILFYIIVSIQISILCMWQLKVMACVVPPSLLYIYVILLNLFLSRICNEYNYATVC
jgi:uncharacterized membrane protein